MFPYGIGAADWAEAIAAYNAKKAAEDKPAPKPRHGFACNRCDEFNVDAEANQEDGTYRCWQCRRDPFR